MFWRTVVRQDDRTPKQTAFDRAQTNPTTMGGSIEGVSFSGYERNNLFLNEGGQKFTDVSGVSGVDHVADGRAMGVLDYDRDGWTDLAVVNANRPLLQLFRNQVGDRPKTAGRTMLAVRFVGGNRKPAPGEGWSTRDGYGAILEVPLEGATLLRELRAGEGFASQNSDTLLIGLGDGVAGAPLRVRWPSGREQSLDFAPAGSLVTVYEDARESEDGSGFALSPYRIAGLAARAEAAAQPGAAPVRLALAASDDGSGPKLQLVTTMATWCKVCQGELPQIARLRAEFGPEQLGLLAVPVDEDDDAAALDAYLARWKPAYRMLRDLSEAEVAGVKQIVVDGLRVDALPASILTDRQGRVLRTQGGIPSVSEIRAALGGQSG